MAKRCLPKRSSITARPPTPTFCWEPFKKATLNTPKPRSPLRAKPPGDGRIRHGKNASFCCAKPPPSWTGALLKWVWFYRLKWARTGWKGWETWRKPQISSVTPAIVWKPAMALLPLWDATRSAAMKAAMFPCSNLTGCGWSSAPSTSPARSPAALQAPRW